MNFSDVEGNIVEPEAAFTRTYSTTKPLTFSVHSYCFIHAGSIIINNSVVVCIAVVCVNLPRLMRFGEINMFSDLCIITTLGWGSIPKRNITIL